MGPPQRETFVHLTPAAVLLFYAVAAAAVTVSVGGFRSRLRGLGLRAMLRNPPGGAAAALRRVAQLGLLQRGVLRRVRGWPHAALVTGVLLASLGTTLVAIDWDLLRPLGRRLLEGRLYLTFEAVMDLAGVLLIIGAAAGLAWRLFSPAKQSGRVHRQQVAALGALIFIGVSGFAVEGLRLALHPPAWEAWSFVGIRIARALGPLGGWGGAVSASTYQALWWAHALAALGLLALLPAGIGRHAVTAPLNLAASPERPTPALATPFDLREVVQSGRFDVRVGASRIEDFASADRLALLACTQCGRCQDVCPAHVTGASLNPRSLVHRLEGWLAGSVRQTPTVDELSVAENLWSCTTCGACAEACPVLVRPVNYIVPLRRELVSRQKLDARQTLFLDNLLRCRNPYGLPQHERGALARNLGLPSPAEAPAADWLYWIGCAGSFDPRIARVVQASVEVFTAAGLRLAALGGEEVCTGDAARRLGEEGLFQQLALENIETLRRHGVRRIVTHCPHCFNTLKHEYPTFGGEYEVVHHTELIERLVREGRIRPQAGREFSRASDRIRVALHDACTLARGNGMTAAPRTLIDSAGRLERVELPRSGRGTFCCGSGGAAFWYDVGARETPATVRAREAAASGARLLAVECPFCLKRLEEAAAGTEGGALEVRDVAELVALSLERATSGTSP